MNKRVMGSLENGIALIQVLLITAILSVLALYFTSTARDQVKIAQWADDKTLALMKAESAQAQLLFELLTSSKLKGGEASLPAGYSSTWNFHSMPFSLTNGVSIEMQDQSGLIHAYFPHEQRLKALINKHTLDDNLTNQIYDSLLDWQDLDSIPRINGDESLRDLGNIRNGAMPSVYDLYRLDKIPLELASTLASNMSIYRKGFLNPMNASAELIAAMSNDSIAEQIDSLRSSGQLSVTTFKELTGIEEDERTLLYPSNFIAIQVLSKVGESEVKSMLVVELDPYATKKKKPINILSTEG